MGISSQSAVFCSRKGLEAQSEGWGHTSWRLSQTRNWGFPVSTTCAQITHGREDADTPSFLRL